MARSRCEACGETVRIAGGIGGIWRGEQAPTGGMTLELDDGSEHFLCFDCIDRLPEQPRRADVEAIAGERS